jgi:hypothetical protein
LGQSQFVGAGRMWVCEVQDGNLAGGSFVVVSPIGGVEEDPVPVRADRSGIEKSTVNESKIIASDNDGAIASPQKLNSKRGA